MLVVKVKTDNIERAIKDLKSKLIRTKQSEILFNRINFTKKSVINKIQKKKAVYRQKLKLKNN